MRALRIILPLILLIILFWLGLWWYAQSQLVASVHRAEAKLRETGWTITHGPITRGSSPLVAQAIVPNLVIMPPGAPGTRPTISFPRVTTRINFNAPFTVALDFPHHFAISAPGGSQISVKADVFTFDYRLDPNALLQSAPDPLRAASTRITHLQASVGGSNFPIFTIGAVTSHLANDPHADDQDTALKIDETIKNIAVSPIFVTLAGLPFGGQIKQIRFKLTASGPDFPDLFNPATVAPATTNPNPLAQSTAQLDAFAAQLRPWASHGGHGRFALSLVIGPLHAKLRTAFNFDHALQPAGHGLVHGTGLTAFFTAITAAQPRFAGAIAAATTAVTPFMTKAPDGHQTLHIVLAVQHRVLTLNGKPATTLPPITWPPAADAPITH